MAFTYTTSGSVIIGGCSDYKEIIYYYYKFGIGSVVYSQPKARKGIFEKVVIKNVRLPALSRDARVKMCHFCELKPLYIDTLNAYWNEEELVSFDDAKDLVDHYVIVRNLLREEAALHCRKMT